MSTVASKQSYWPWLTGALGLLLIQWIFLDWRWEKKFEQVQDQLDAVRDDLAAMQAATGPSAKSRNDLAGDRERLNRALARLGSHNLIDRYQAGMTVRTYGKEAVPALLDLVRTGNANETQTALLLLGEMRSPASLNGLRDIAREALRPKPTAASPSPGAIEDKTLTAVLGILARMKDPEAIPLLKQGLEHRDERVRVAAIVGMREYEDADLLPAIAGRIGKEREIVNTELQKTILLFCREDQDKFLGRLPALPPGVRFEIIKILGKDPGAAALSSLRKLIYDGDHRVALSAAAALARRGDASGRDLAAQLANDKGDELGRLAAEVLKQLDQLQPNR